MNIEFKYELGDIVETRRGETGKIVLASAAPGKRDPLYLTYKLELDSGDKVWAPEYSIDRVIGW
jgi:hypothetical protein